GGQLRHDVLRFLRTDAWKCAQILLVLARDRGRQFGDRCRERPRGDHRPDVLYGDQPLEELLVEIGREADQDGPGLIARGVIVDDQLELAGLVTAVRVRALERAERDRRKKHLIAHTAHFEDDPVFEPPPQPSAEGGDHARRPPAREKPVSASASASATWLGRGAVGSRNNRPTPT